jgi:hypothetical protein
MITLLSNTEAVSQALVREVLVQAPQALLKLFHLIASTSRDSEYPSSSPRKPFRNELSYFRMLFVFLCFELEFIFVNEG